MVMLKLVRDDSDELPQASFRSNHKKWEAMVKRLAHQGLRIDYSGCRLRRRIKLLEDQPQLYQTKR